MNTRRACETAGGLLALVVWMWPNAGARAFMLKRTEDGVAVRWPSSRQVIRLRVDPNVPQVMAVDELHQALAMASDAWRGYPGVPTVDVAPGLPPAYDPHRRGDGIYVISPWIFEPNRLAITVTSYYPTGELVGVDVLINGDVNYGLLPEGPITDDLRRKHDLGAVLTHEFGHVLGLDESEADPAATMWPYIRAGETHQRTLAVDDEEAITLLYADPFGEAPRADCASSVLGRTVRRPGDLAWGWLLACLLLLRRPWSWLVRATRAQPSPWMPNWRHFL